MASPSARAWPATHPHPSGVPASALPLALLVLALPFLLPVDVSVPEGAAALIGGMIVASAGLDHPPYSPGRAHWFTAALAFAALVLVLGQTILDREPAPPLVGLPNVEAPRAAAPAVARKAKRHAKRARADGRERARVAARHGGATVGLTLRAGDRDACGNTVVRRFAVTWQLARTEAGWRATAAAARALSGATPAAAC